MNTQEYNFPKYTLFFEDNPIADDLYNMTPSYQDQNNVDLFSNAVEVNFQGATFCPRNPFYNYENENYQNSINESSTAENKNT